MKKRFSVRKYLLIVLIMGLVCAGVIFGADKLQERENGKQLNRLLEEITYEADKGSVELEILKKFEPATKNMSQRNQARYYRAIAKVHMLRGDMDHALLNFVDAELHAEISKAYDVAAWLYADSAQIYIDLDADKVALDCINMAIEYGGEQPMEEFFYKYCYLMKAELEANGNDISQALADYEKSLEYTVDGSEFPEYHSLEVRENLVLATLKMQQGNNEEAKKYLKEIQKYMDKLEVFPSDELWFSSIYYPYLTLQTKCSLQLNDYDGAKAYMEETFATGTLYGQVSSLMDFLNEVLTFAEKSEKQQFSEELQEKIKGKLQELIVEYPKVFQNKNNVAATHIYNSNMITIAVFVQKYKMERLYKQIAEGVLFVVVIITILILAIRHTEQKARVDGLTGAYIRRYFNEVYEHLKKGNTEFGVIMYDIDFFKQINDGFGHDAGDLVLKKTAHMVMDLLDKDSALFRYGGDEFCIICRKKSLEDMARLAEKIRSDVEKTEWKDGMKVSFSMGAAVASQSPERDVMAKVDEKLYASKEAGRNKVSW